MTRLRTGLAPVNDIQMYYQIHGDGTPLILLHGGLGTGETRFPPRPGSTE